ncbi:EAL domain-containing protein [Colwelliaceae bacterium 6471]
MDSTCSRRFYKSLLSLMLMWLGLFSFPVFSAPPVFSFTEFNIAFVLGLSIPVLVIVAVMKPVVEVKWWFPALITASLLGMLYASLYLSTYQVLGMLSCAMIFLVLLCLWLVKSSAEFNGGKLSIATNTMASCALVYLVALWLLPTIDAYIAWAAFAGLILCLAGYCYWLLVKNTAIKVYRVVFQWLLCLMFVVTMFMWLNTKLDILWLVVAAVLSYLVALINGCWLLVERLLAIEPVQENTESVSVEDMHSLTHDPATNLPSYQQVLYTLENTIKLKSKSELAVIVFKPINFQQVNSVLGHHNSDILLLQLAYCLQQKMSENSHLINFGPKLQPARIARLHSLNFVAVLDLSHSHHPNETLISDICQQLSAAVPDAMSFKSFSLNFDLSFGIAIMGEHGNNVSEVIAHAGDALLEGEKNQHKLSYFDNKSILFAEQQLLQMERLKEDVSNENLRWYLQPQIGLSDHSLKGFELKVHWYNNSDSPLELEAFIATAEHSGDIYLLTKHMIKQAFKGIYFLQKQGVYQPVSVNLLSKHILEPDLVDFIELQIKTFNVPAKYLLIELTEEVMLSASDRAKSIIDQLKSLDVGISIDGFSGSYESLRYLRKMSISQVKIDCQQLDVNSQSRADKAIINALINLTRNMKLPLIGTNIDSADAERAFSAMGGEFAQGQHINRGFVIDELEIWLENWFKQYPPRKV